MVTEAGIIYDTRWFRFSARISAKFRILHCMLFPLLCSSLMVFEFPASSSTVLRMDVLLLLEANGRETRLVPNAKMKKNAITRISVLNLNSLGLYVE